LTETDFNGIFNFKSSTVEEESFGIATIWAEQEFLHLPEMILQTFVIVHDNL
jgi:hypothetical protein